MKSNAPLTALVTARLVMVAPLIALTVPLFASPEPSFTTESPEECAHIARAFLSGAPLEGEFTRG